MAEKALNRVMIRTQLTSVWRVHLLTKQMPSYAPHAQTSYNQGRCRTAGNAKVPFVWEEYTPTLATMAAVSFVELRDQLRKVDDYRFAPGDEGNMLLSWEGLFIWLTEMIPCLLVS